ncbi:MAG: threonine--tRNA ligase [Candidatus Paceibacterota bacterium]
MNNIEPGLVNKRHTLAHLLAAAVLELYPDAKPTIGPAIDNGFYYDFEFSAPITEEDLPKIEKKMRSLLPSWKEMSGKEISSDEAQTTFKTNSYKLELIDEIIGKGEKITLYTAGNFTDLCRGGHTENPAKEIAADSFTLVRIAGAYWRGSEKNKMLTRIYGLAFENKKALDEYENMLKEAEKRDHKKLGKDLDLFLIDEEVGRGLPMWTPKGTAIKFVLEKYTRDLETKYGYEHVSTPYLGSEKLYKTSGHLDHYKKNMYAPIDMDGDIFYLRPMACPHHIRMLLRKPLSYRDLPVRYAEIADYNRYEKSGELMGMIRLRKFQLTDAHIFVSPEGLKEEFINVCRLIQEGMKGLGLDSSVNYRFSKRDPNNKEKYFPDDELWNKAEKVMKEALDETGLQYTEALDEAAFYGPKLDIQARNVNGKEDTLFTAQIDFLLPEKFDINYTAKDGSKQRVVMIHRSAIGALERTFAFLIEHYGGNFPLWLAPVQVKVIPVGDAYFDHAKKINDELRSNSMRSEVDLSDDGFGKKIRNAKTARIPYFIIIGEKDVAVNKVTLESRDRGQVGQLGVEEVLKMLEIETKNKK